ncbi:DUF6265 family protein [Aliikangiella coralliicola]|uniref:Nuclear transport factor 2 family protein n=1 Tax=Aliikangiella coralliicola TaxID=2592383 RepID=A0A545U7I2_9GAMM|nr:DUF6265 family protein [Aliikangiella coralliicola]TQV85424.1 nuclear transport factor 2 family protein [Aliikangiella coralliicola]
MKIIPGLFWALFCLSVSATDKVNCRDIQSTNWLIGQWTAKSGKSTVEETWKVLDKQNMVGFSATTQLGVEPHKTASVPFVETLRIVEMSGEIFYLAKTPQNEFPVAFKLIDCSSTRLKFENRQHDFPNVIEYNRISNSRLLVKVRGNDGKGFDINYTSQKMAASKNALDNSMSVSQDKAASNEALVVRYVRAYNESALTEMMGQVNEDVQWMSMKDNQVIVETGDKAELRKAMQHYFSGGGDTKSTLVSLISGGSFVSAIEKATWKSNGKSHSQCSPVVYEVEDGLIKNVWYYRAEKC